MASKLNLKTAQGIVDFIFEINNLKRFKHCGVKFAGVANPDSIAEHVFRTTQIAYILGTLENFNDSELLELLLIALFHDNGEVRINDTHKIASRYLDTHQAEQQAFLDQIENLPENTQLRLRQIINSYNQHAHLKVYTVARDADLLETIFQAKEYAEVGYKTDRWITNGRHYLKTKSAIAIYDSLLEKSFTDWWTHLNTTQKPSNPKTK